MSYNCTKCNSENTQKFSLIHRNGSSNVDLATTGVGVGRGGLSVGTAATNGTTQSHLATKCAPPEKMKLLGPAFAVFILGAIASIWLGQFAVWAGIGLAIFYIFTAIKHNRNEFPKLYAEWDRKFLCMRCENVFLVE